MHQLNVLFLGSDSFKSTLNELKFNLKFKLSCGSSNLDVNTISKYDVLFIHREILENKEIREIIINVNAVKILEPPLRVKIPGLITPPSIKIFISLTLESDIKLLTPGDVLSR